MSVTILEFARAFAVGRLTAEEFANAYIELWRIERDKQILQKDSDNMSACLSSIFCLTDLYAPEPDKEDYELDSDQLRKEIDKIIRDSGL